jgi:hypothetical protein
MSEEQKVPSKEEVVAFLKEQIEVKELQAQLQELNTRLAKGRAEELQALSYVAQITNPQQPEGTPHIVTEEDLANNPELAEQGVQVGDEVLIPGEPKKRNLKKQK